MLDGLDEPVRRYFAHALAPKALLSRRVRLRMTGRVRVGLWLRYTSTWEGDGRSFSWRAVSGPGPFPLLAVHDRFAGERGFMDIRLRMPGPRVPALKLLHAESEDVARSGAGRAALEALWVPPALLPDRGVRWHAESDEVIVACWAVAPEQPELRILIGEEGEVRCYRVQRWHDAKHGYVPFGADVHGERTFGGLTIPSRLTAGWHHGTAAWSPFFEAEITALEPGDHALPKPVTT